jgi:hypothetical protein
MIQINSGHAAEYSMRTCQTTSAVQDISLVHVNFRIMCTDLSMDWALCAVQWVSWLSVKSAWLVLIQYLLILVFQSGLSGCLSLSLSCGWYHIVVLALTLYRLLRHRRDIPRQLRSKLVDVLWVDGLCSIFPMLNSDCTGWHLLLTRDYVFRLHVLWIFLSISLHVSWTDCM